MGRGDMPEERHLRTIASAPLSEQAAVWTKQKPKKGQTAGWCAIADSLMKRQMFARDAKFGEKEEAAFWGGKPGKRIASRSPSTRETGRSARSISRPLPPLRRRKTGAGAGADTPAAELKVRPDIAQKGREMIGEMRTEALVKALGREGLTSETLIGLLVLALAADNVSIRTHEYAPIQSIVSVIAEGGKLTSDTALIHTTAIKVLQTVLNCRLAYGVGSGFAARIAGDAIGADADLPHMRTEEFLACLSRAALEAEATRHRVLPRGRSLRFPVR